MQGRHSICHYSPFLPTPPLPNGVGEVIGDLADWGWGVRAATGSIARMAPVFNRRLGEEKENPRAYANEDRKRKPKCPLT